MKEEAQHRLKALDLKCRRPVEHLLAGEFRSVFKGRGIEFEDTRVYEPGDDVRSMDWRVTARTGVPHVKRYVEEREQQFYLLVDLSGSALSDAEGRKRETVAEFCSLLAMAALKNNDQVALVLFTNDVEYLVPLGKGRRQGIRIMDALVSFEPRETGTDLTAGLNVFGHLARKRSVAFMISDFLSSGFESELQAAAYKHDVIAVRIVEPQELEPPQCGLVRIRDAETDVERIVDFSAGGEPGGASIDRMRETMLDCGVELIELLPGEDCVMALSAFFRSRRRLVADETGG